MEVGYNLKWQKCTQLHSTSSYNNLYMTKVSSPGRHKQ